MKKYSKLMAIILAVAMVLPGVAQAAAPVAKVAQEDNAIRLSGDSRVGTALEASKEAYDKADTVVIAGSGSEVDALAGTLLANDKGAPLLLSGKKEIREDVLAHIKDLGAKNVYILGGEKAVPKKVANQLKGLKVTRVNGKNRNETAVKVAELVKGKSINKIFLASGADTNLSDALAIGPVSAKNDIPVFLTNVNKIPGTTIDAIKALGVKEVVVIGGEKIISKNVVNELGNRFKDRISGSNRYNTAIKIANKYFTNPEKVIIANGYKIADALVGGYLGAMNDAPILLVNTDLISENTLMFLEDNTCFAYILGGSKVVSERVIDEIIKVVGCEEDEMRTIESIEKFEDIEVKFGGEYELPKEVKVSLSDKEVVKILVEWNDKDIDVKKAGIYKVEGALDFTGVINLEAEARETKSTLNVVVLEKVLYRTDLENLIESIEYVEVSEAGLNIDKENMWTDQAERTAIEEAAADVEKFLAGKEFDFSVNKGEILELSVGPFNYEVDGKWIVTNPSILSIESTGSSGVTMPGYIRKSYNVELLALGQGYTTLFFVDYDNKVLNSTVIKVFDESKPEFTQQELKFAINNLEKAIKVYEKAQKPGNKPSEAEKLAKVTEEVEKAEKTLKQEDVDIAQKLVDELMDSDAKENLKNRLAIVQNKIDEELEQAKVDAKLDLEAYVNSEDYTENAEELAAAIVTGKDIIEAAETKVEVSAALKNVKLAIDEIKTDYEVELGKNYEYRFINDNMEVEITKYNGQGGDIEIPSEINGKPVTSIYNNTFSEKELTNVKLPEELTIIGWSAFSKNYLKNLVIPDTVTDIGSSAFSNNLLITATLPKKLTAITDSVFENNFLEEIDLPSTITTIGSSAFNNNNLKGLINIPEGVKYIGSRAFMGNSIESLIIPDTVTEIGVYAFWSNNLRKVTIPGSIKKLTGEVFASNPIRSVVILDGVLGIGENNFSNVPNVTMPDGVLAIGKDNFDDRFREVYSKNGAGIYTIAYDGWIKLSEDTNFIFDELTKAIYGLTSEGEEHFKGNVVIPKKINNIDVISIGSNAFSNKGLTKITIPDSIREIGDYAFENNNLTELIIPDSVKNIGHSSFMNNILESIKIGKDVVISDELLGWGNNKFREIYSIEGAGTYTGTQEGDWIKQ